MDLEQITHSAPVGRERGLWDARIVAAGQTVQGWIDELAPDTARFISEAPLPEETSFELSLTLASGLPSPVRVEARGMVQYSVLSGRRFRTELHLTEITQQRQVYLDYLQHDRTVYFQTDTLQSVRWKAFLTPSNDVREESAVFGWVNRVSGSALGFLSEVKLPEKTQVNVSLLAVSTRQAKIQRWRVDVLAEVQYSILSAPYFQSGLRVVAPLSDMRLDKICELAFPG